MSPTLLSAGDALPKRTLPSASQRLTALHRHVVLWALQVGLAMFFAGAGYAKLTEPLDLLSFLLGWTAAVSPETVRATGWLEISAALGMLAPLISWRLRPVLLASAVVVLVLAGLMTAYHGIEACTRIAVVHAQLAVVNALLFAMASAVLVGRLPPPGPTGRSGERSALGRKKATAPPSHLRGLVQGSGR